MTAHEQTPVLPGVDPVTAHHIKALKMVRDSLLTAQLDAPPCTNRRQDEYFDGTYAD